MEDAQTRIKQNPSLSALIKEGNGNPAVTIDECMELLGLSRREALALFNKANEDGIGRVKSGRRGKPTRLIWAPNTYSSSQYQSYNDRRPLEMMRIPKPLERKDTSHLLDRIVGILNEMTCDGGISVKDLGKIIGGDYCGNGDPVNFYPSEKKTNFCSETAYFLGLKGGELASGHGHLTHKQIIEKAIQHYHACEATENFILVSDHYSRDAMQQWSTALRNIARERSIIMALITGQNYSIINL